MAFVFRGWDTTEQRAVAFKVLKRHYASAVGPSRFLREIRLLTQLHHPGILPLLDSGHTETLFYFVMPLVEGETLQRAPGARAPAAARRGAADRLPGRGGARLRPRRRHRPPRHQAQQSVPVRGPGAGRRLRDREGPLARGRREHHQHRARRGHRAVHEPGAGGRPAPTRPPGRRLFARLRRLPDAGGRASLHRSEPRRRSLARHRSMPAPSRGWCGPSCPRASTRSFGRRWPKSPAGPVSAGRRLRQRAVRPGQARGRGARGARRSSRAGSALEVAPVAVLASSPSPGRRAPAPSRPGRWTRTRSSCSRWGRRRPAPRGGRPGSRSR